MRSFVCDVLIGGFLERKRSLTRGFGGGGGVGDDDDDDGDDDVVVVIVVVSVGLVCGNLRFVMTYLSVCAPSLSRTVWPNHQLRSRSHKGHCVSVPNVARVDMERLSHQRYWRGGGS